MANGIARKQGGAERNVSRKVHLAIDEATLEVRTVEAIGWRCEPGSRQIAPQLLVRQ